MGNVLHIETTDMAKATGFFKKQSGPENTEYVVYLPSLFCDTRNYEMCRAILTVVALRDIEWDYFIVHDGDYAAASVTGFINLFADELRFSPTARMNIPVWVGDDL